MQESRYVKLTKILLLFSFVDIHRCVGEDCGSGQELDQNWHEEQTGKIYEAKIKIKTFNCRE